MSILFFIVLFLLVHVVSIRRRKTVEIMSDAVLENVATVPFGLCSTCASFHEAAASQVFYNSMSDCLSQLSKILYIP